MIAIPFRVGKANMNGTSSYLSMFNLLVQMFETRTPRRLVLVPVSLHPEFLRTKPITPVKQKLS